jgi:hypothetical protein
VSVRRIRRVSNTACQTQDAQVLTGGSAASVAWPPTRGQRPSGKLFACFEVVWPASAAAKNRAASGSAAQRSGLHYQDKAGEPSSVVGDVGSMHFSEPPGNGG